MKIDILTLFPDMCRSVFMESITGRAVKAGLIEINAVNIRDYSADKRGRVDDTPYGGGPGMIIKCQPVFDCFEAVCGKNGSRPHLIYMSPKGKTLNQEKVKELSKLDSIAILCGHYEGIDQRVIDEIVDEEISIGDFVVTGGEIPALLLTDAVARMIPGVLSSDESFENESFFDGLLEYPQYTKPFSWNNIEVPEILVSGDHGKIDKWKKEKAVEITKKRRPDLFEKKFGGGGE